MGQKHFSLNEEQRQEYASGVILDLMQNEERKFNVVLEGANLDLEPLFVYMMAKEYRYFKTVAELPGDGVVIVGSTAGLLSVIKATGSTSLVLGFANYSIKKDSFVAGDYIDICFRDCVMFMEAGASIEAGKQVMIAVTGSKIITATPTNASIGTTLELASGDGILIPVLIETPVHTVLA